MKYIGIITATNEEFEAITSKFDNLNNIKVKFLNCCTCSLNEKNYIITKAGVGKVNAAATTQILIDNFDIEYIINVGVAGALNDNLNVTDIVIGKRLVQHDFDTTAFGDEKGYVMGVGKFFETDIKLVEKSKECLEKEGLNGMVGTIATGDIFCTEMAMKEKIRKNFGADCVEMEGGSIAQICYLNKIPFIVLRAISDKVNGSNQMEYEQFAKIAADYCARFVLKI